MSEKESKELKTNGAFELNASGKLSKSSTPPDLFKDLLKKKNKSWRYQLEIIEATEAFEALIQNRPAKSVISNGFFIKGSCLYCHKALNPGNTSRFCNKRCLQLHASNGPLTQ